MRVRVSPSAPSRFICHIKCSLAHDYAGHGLSNEKIMAGIKLGIISLAAINVIAVFDLTGIAAQAEYGFSTVLFVSTPLIIYSLRKPYWDAHDTSTRLEPFSRGNRSGI